MAAAGLAQGAESSAPRSAPAPALLWALAVAGCTAAGISLALAITSDHVEEPGVVAPLICWITLNYVLAGLIAWWRRPESRFGPLMLAAGFANFLATLSWANVAGLFTLGQALDLVPPVIFLHVFLAFPSGRLGRGFARTVVVAAYATAIGAELVSMLLGGAGPDNLLELVAQPEAASVALRTGLGGLSGLMLTGVVILAARRRRSGRPLRRSIALLVDSFACGLVMIAFLFSAGAAGLVEGQALFEAIRRAAFFLVGLAPFAFLLGLLQARLARSAVGALLVELRANPSPGALQAALARALRDPSLTLLYWLPEYGGWAGLDGRTVRLPDGDPARATTLIDRDDAHVAALVHDPSLDDERELLEAVAAAAAITLENTRLQVELRARLDELKASRLRILEAGQSERRRMERNLHDGAQQRLVCLSLELGLLERRFAADPEARDQIDQAKRELAGSLEDLRELARGLHPAALTGHGLTVALEGLVARAPQAVGLHVRLDARLPEQHEVAAYYLVSESLTNVAKYAHASKVSVDVARAGGQLVVEVTDDGCGGASTDGGSGLRGLADRVEALDGRLRVQSPEGGGTRVRAEIPCA